MAIMHTNTLLTMCPHPTLLRHTGPDSPERRCRLPVHAVARDVDLVVQLVDLLEGQAFRLVDHEVDECDAEEAACEPDEEDSGLEVGIAVAPGRKRRN